VHAALGSLLPIIFHIRLTRRQTDAASDVNHIIIISAVHQINCRSDENLTKQLSAKTANFVPVNVSFTVRCRAFTRASGQLDDSVVCDPQNTQYFEDRCRLGRLLWSHYKVWLNSGRMHVKHEQKY